MSDSLLIVDDDADLLRVVGDYFERLGFEVYREGTGEAALESYARHRPEVVILDEERSALLCHWGCESR